MQCPFCSTQTEHPAICGRCLSIMHYIHTPEHFKYYHKPVEDELFVGPAMLDGKFYDLYVQVRQPPEPIIAFAVFDDEIILDARLGNEAIERLQMCIAYLSPVQVQGM